MTDSTPTPDREPLPYELPELFADELDDLDPVATLYAQLDRGPSARVSAEYLGGRRVDGVETDDSWIEGVPQVRPPGPWFQVGADDEILTDRGILDPYAPRDTDYPEGWWEPTPDGRDDQ